MGESHDLGSDIQQVKELREQISRLQEEVARVPKPREAAAKIPTIEEELSKTPKLREDLVKLRDALSKIPILQEELSKVPIPQKELSKIPILQEELFKLPKLRTADTPLQERISMLQEELVFLQPLRDETHSVRMTVLDSHIQGRHKDIANIRNKLLYGGHILADMSIIDEFSGNEEDEKFIRRAAAFKQIYGTEFQKIKDYYLGMSEVVRHTYNIRGDLMLLNLWQTGERFEEAKYVKKWCGEILKKWESWIESGNEGSQPDIGEDNLVWVQFQNRRNAFLKCNIYARTLEV